MPTTLSSTSVLSLQAQGGAAVDHEMICHPWWSDALRLRRYDDAAKVPGADALSIEDVLAIAERVAQASRDAPMSKVARWSATGSTNSWQTWTEGDPVPAERDLAVRFGVARDTVRQALHELLLEGRIQRRGRGTVVAKPKLTQPLSLRSYTEGAERMGRKPGRILVTWEDIEATPDLCGRTRCRTRGRR